MSSDEYDFELTSEQYRDIQQALEYAENNAVHEDIEVRFHQVRVQLHHQYERQLE